MNGGRFDFDDGGTYVGGWEEGKAHGHGVCTGPRSKGEFSGAWHYGFEVSGTYTWPSGNSFAGQWQNGKRHGLGVEKRGRWTYMGEWTQGTRGRYGSRHSTTSQARYEGTWSAGFHDGYGTETYVDGGYFQGQWLRGTRHGYGIRKSAPYSAAAKYRARATIYNQRNNASLTSLRSGRLEEDEDDIVTEKRNGRGGFVLKANSAVPQKRRRSLSERSLTVKNTIFAQLRIRKQHSTGDIHQKSKVPGSLKSCGSSMSCASEDSERMGHGNLEPKEEVIEDDVTEKYVGEWKDDARCGFGVCERSDGLKYKGEWVNNTKTGFGVTFFPDGTREEGRYKNNVLVSSMKRKSVMFIRAVKSREKIESILATADRTANITLQKAEIVASRTETARERALQAVIVAHQAKEDSETARIHAKQFDPTFKQPGTKTMLRDFNGGESFGTDLTDALTYSKHLSQTHSKQHSFEQNLSFDQDEPSTSAKHQHLQYSHNHLPSTSNHVNFQTPYGYDDSNLMIPQDSQMPYHERTSQHNLMSNNVMDVNIAHPVHPVVEEDEKPLMVGPTTPTQNHTNIMHQFPSTSTPSSSNLTATIPNVMSSRFSLSDDHYDQYVMANAQNNAAAGASSSSSSGGQAAQKLRRNRPSLMRQADVNESSAGTSGLNRRSTLASARDRNGDINALGAGKTDKDAGADQDNMGSLPNLAELEVQGVRMRREEASRLAGQRRQEVLREQEEQALLRANPLRHLLQPSFRAFLMRWRIPIFLAVANFTLLCLFYHLLTHEKKNKSSK